MNPSSTPRYWAGFDLGGTKMLACVYDASFTCLGRARKKSRGIDGPETGLSRMVDIVREALDAAGVSPDDLGGIGIGCPGPVDLAKGVLLNAPNLGWKDVRIAEAFEGAFGCPAVLVNDVDSGVYGEYRFGAGRGSRTTVGIFPGTGIGGGCVYDGEILRGASRSCMEIGHIQVLPGGPLCSCGRRGCLEAVCSRLVIASAAATAALRGHAPVLLEHAGTDLAAIRSRVISASVQGGDQAVEAVVRDAARWIGRGVAVLVNLLMPDVVVLGGGLVESMPDLFRTVVANAARKHVMPSFEDTFRVEVAELSDDAAVQGAAAWAEHCVMESITAAQGT